MQPQPVLFLCTVHQGERERSVAVLDVGLTSALSECMESLSAILAASMVRGTGF